MKKNFSFLDCSTSKQYGGFLVCVFSRWRLWTFTTSKSLLETTTVFFVWLSCCAPDILQDLLSVGKPTRILIIWSIFLYLLFERFAESPRFCPLLQYPLLDLIINAIILISRSVTATMNGARNNLTNKKIMIKWFSFELIQNIYFEVMLKKTEAILGNFLRFWTFRFYQNILRKKSCSTATELENPKLGNSEIDTFHVMISQGYRICCLFLLLNQMLFFVVVTWKKSLLKRITDAWCNRLILYWDTNSSIGKNLKLGLLHIYYF